MLASNLCLFISIVSFHGLQHHRSSYEFLELTNFNATGSNINVNSFQNPKDWPIVETQRELQPAATFDRRLRCQPRKLFSESETAILFSGGVPPPPLPVLSRKLFGLRMLEEGIKCEILTRCYAFKMRLFLAGFFCSSPLVRVSKQRKRRICFSLGGGGQLSFLLIGINCHRWQLGL